VKQWSVKNSNSKSLQRRYRAVMQQNNITPLTGILSTCATIVLNLVNDNDNIN
jgi:hypothetical protein